jgi:Fe-S cluster biogenesis protein NfuA/nitrite reductase/ring-hydroxylating ferredoxin subunit
MQDAAVRQEVQAVEELLARVEELPAGRERTDALAAIQGLLRLYGEALGRITALVGSSAATLEALAADELVSQLLLLHGLHPATLEERIAQALDEVRPYMGSHGGGIELVEVVDGVARVRLEGTCSGCAASTVTLKLAVQDAILRAAPEIHTVEAIEPIEGVAPVGGSPLPMFDAGAAAPVGRWLYAGDAGQLGARQPLRREVGGHALLFAHAGGELYAYLDRCPVCRGPVEDPRLEDSALRCAGCGRAYDVRRAGVGIDGGLVQLEPVPLLVADGQVRVAVEAVAA